MYVWCKAEPDLMVTLWFVPVKSANLPWAMLALSVLMGGDIFSDLIGIAAGHSYYFLKEVLPQSHGHNLLKTPQLITNLVKDLERWSNSRQEPTGFFGR